MFFLDDEKSIVEPSFSSAGEISHWMVLLEHGDVHHLTAPHPSVADSKLEAAIVTIPLGDT